MPDREQCLLSKNGGRKIIHESKGLKFFDPHLSTDSLRVFRSVASKGQASLMYRHVFIAFDLANSQKNDKSVRWTPQSDRVSLDWPWIHDAQHRGLYLPQWYGLVPSNVTAGLPHRPIP